MDIFGRKQIALLQNQLLDLQEENRDLSIEFKSRADLADSLTEQNKDLDHRLKELEKELARQKSGQSSKCALLEKEISALTKELSKAEDQKKKSEKSLSDLKAEKEKRGQEIKALNERISAEKKRMTDLESLAKSKESEVAALRTERDSAKKDLDDKIKTFEALAGEKEEILKQVKEARKELSEEKKKQGQVESVRKELKDCKDQMDKSKKEFLNEKKTLEQQLGEKNLEVSKEKELRLKMKAELDEGKVNLNKVQSDYDKSKIEFQKEKSELEAALRNAEQKLAETNSKLNELNASKNSSGELVESLQVKLKAANDELAGLISGKTKAEEQLKDCQEKLMGLQEKNNKIEAELNNLNEAKKELEDDVEQKNGLIEASEERCARIEKRLKRKVEKLAETEGKVKELEEQIKVLHDRPSGEISDAELAKTLAEIRDENKKLKEIVEEEARKKAQLDNWYDGKLEVSLISDLSHHEKGWNIVLANPNLSTTQSLLTCSIVGKYKSGKTFLLSGLTNQPSTLTKETSQLSLKTSSNHLLFIDTVGRSSHVRSKHFEKSENTLYDHTIQEILFYLSNHVVFVVNNFTDKEQSCLKTWTRKIKQHKGPDEPKYIILVHNFQAVSTEQQYRQAWEKQVVQVLQVSESIKQSNKEIVLNIKGAPHTSQVNYIKKHHVIHCALLDNDSEYGAYHNLFTFEFIRARLTQKTQPKPLNFVEKLTHVISTVTGEPNINLSEIPDKHYNRKIIARVEHPDQFRLRLNQLVKVKGYDPAFEVLEQPGKYLIVLDIPGLTEDDVKVESEDGKVWVSGLRKGHEEGMKGFGEFLCKFRIPKQYNHSPSKITVQHGVMVLNFIENNS